MFLLLLYSVLSNDSTKNKWSDLDHSSVEVEESLDSKFIILTLESLEDLDDKKLKSDD